MTSDAIMRGDPGPMYKMLDELIDHQPRLPGASTRPGQSDLRINPCSPARLCIAGISAEPVVVHPCGMCHAEIQCRQICLEVRILGERLALRLRREINCGPARSLHAPRASRQSPGGTT
jgi:hypothetical protein